MPAAAELQLRAILQHDHIIAIEMGMHLLDRDLRLLNDECEQTFLGGELRTVKFSTAKSWLASSTRIESRRK